MTDETSRGRGEDHDPDARGRWTKAGVAMGIGSAALVAALLYAGRTKREDKPRPREDYMD